MDSERPAPESQSLAEQFPFTGEALRQAFGDPVRHTCPGCGGEHSLAQACSWVMAQGGPMGPRVWRFIHNAIAHPLMVVLPERWGTWIHDETARRAWETP